MPEITVTKSQRETLDEIRSDLSAAYIDTYGHVRTTDVVQYLLDTYTPPEEQAGDVAYERIATAEFPQLQAVAANVEDVPGSGIDAETMRGELLSTLGVEELAARLSALDGTDGEEESSEADSGDGERVTDGDDASTDASSATDGAADNETADDADTDGNGESDSTSTAGGPGSAGGSADSILSAANQLLDDHDDKWRKGDGNEPYEVDLPDGTTKTVRTKDDIRQILFKHY